MGKGKDKKSKSSKSKKSKGPELDWSLYPEGTTEIPNTNFYFGYDGFMLLNGDCYVGDYCAHRMGVTWREGNGVYITKDDHTYEGVWENDLLLNSEDTTVRYPDGVVFRGSIKKNKYSGAGTYTLENQLPIKCNFEENTPYGEAILTDPQNHLWKGIVGAEYVVLLPENHYYVSMPYERGMGKKVSINQSQEEILNAQSIKSDGSCMRELKELIFKRSTKTLNDFKETLIDEETVNENLEPTGVKVSRPVSSLLKARSGSNISLLKTFLSKEYRNSCPPVSIFYPTADIEEKEEPEEQTPS